MLTSLLSRFSDFMVYEVGLDGEILHLKDINPPIDTLKDAKAEASTAETKKEEPVEPATETKEVREDDQTIEQTDDVEEADPVADEEQPEPEAEPAADNLDLPEPLRFAPAPEWPTETTRELLKLLKEDTIVKLHDLFLEGRTPPKGAAPPSSTLTAEEEAMSGEPSSRGQGRDRGRGRGRDRRDRGGRGARGGRGGGGSYGERVEDPREVLSDVCRLPCDSRAGADASAAHLGQESEDRLPRGHPETL